MTSPVSRPLSSGQRQALLILDRLILAGSRHWLLILNLLFGAYVVTPWLAPVLMETGHPVAARAIV